MTEYLPVLYILIKQEIVSSYVHTVCIVKPFYYMHVYGMQHYVKFLDTLQAVYLCIFPRDIHACKSVILCCVIRIFSLLPVFLKSSSEKRVCVFVCLFVCNAVC